ncbi:MAG: gephyrin-like molybdotransferase Glp [Myxococcota bacterium]
MLTPYPTALAQALDGLSLLGRERVPLERAVGRYLAEDLVAATPLPPFSYSAMDGYALRASDVPTAGTQLPVVGEAAAGHPSGALLPRTSCRIFTGGVLPEGADAVVIQENTTRENDEIKVNAVPFAGQNVRTAGTDLGQGSTALRTGTRLSPAALGLAATLERTHLFVGRRPQVTILSTGDELRLPSSPGRPGSVVDSNSFVLAAIAQRAGADPRIAPLVLDVFEVTVRELTRALRGTDLLITVGGASVGDRDLMREALEHLGAEVAFWGIRVKPGKPTAVATLGDKRILVLPGNPGSATLSSLIFGVPMLRRMQGAAGDVAPRRVKMRVLGGHERRPGREEYLRAQLSVREGEMVATIGDNQSSGAVTSFAYAEALIAVPHDRARVKPGDMLDVIRLDELWGG